MLAPFLCRHPELHTLLLDPFSYGTFLPPSPGELSVPSLRNLSAQPAWVVSVAASGSPLEQIHSSTPAQSDAYEWIVPGLTESLLHVSATLKRIVIQYFTQEGMHREERAWFDRELPHVEVVSHDMFSHCMHSGPLQS